MKIKKGQKYRILIDYKDRSNTEIVLEEGTIVEVCEVIYVEAQKTGYTGVFVNIGKSILDEQLIPLKAFQVCFEEIK